MDYKKLSYILTVVACITLIGMGVVLFVIFADVQAQLKEQKKASHEAISQRDQNNDQNDTSHSEVARLKKYVTKLTGDVTKLTGDVTKLTGDFTKLTGQMDDSKIEMKQNLGFVTNHLNESTKEMDKLKIQLTTLNDNSRDEVSDLQTRISQLESQLTSQKRINKILQKSLPDKWEFCGAGVQSTSIVADDQLTASTSASNDPPRNARLLGKVGSGVWCSNRQANDWIQVDFEQQKAISGVVTQGYHGGSHRVTSYKVSYQRTNEGFTTITDQSGSIMVFQGNEDSNTPVAHDFPTEITARYFRIIVVTSNTWPCLRFDYLTC